METNKMDHLELLTIAGAVLFPHVGGFYGGKVFFKSIDHWYNNLNFPSYRPPNWLFYPIWFLLYSVIGFASYLVWKEGGGFQGPAQVPLICYAVQLVLNWAWTPLFFGKRNLKLATIEIVLLTIVAGATGVLFYGIIDIAGFLFIPYVAWLLYTSILSNAIHKLNKYDDDPFKTKQP